MLLPKFSFFQYVYSVHENGKEKRKEDARSYRQMSGSDAFLNKNNFLLFHDCWNSSHKDKQGKNVIRSSFEKNLGSSRCYSVATSNGTIFLDNEKISSLIPGSVVVSTGTTIVTKGRSSKKSIVIFLESENIVGKLFPSKSPGVYEFELRTLPKVDPVCKTIFILRPGSVITWNDWIVIDFVSQEPIICIIDWNLKKIHEIRLGLFENVTVMCVWNDHLVIGKWTLQNEFVLEIWSKEFKLVKKFNETGMSYNFTSVATVWNDFLVIATGISSFKFLDFEGKYHLLPTTEKYDARYCIRPFSNARGNYPNRPKFWKNFLVADDIDDGVRFWNEFGSCVYFISFKVSTTIFVIREEKTSDNEPSSSVYSFGEYFEKFELPNPIHPKLFLQ